MELKDLETPENMARIEAEEDRILEVLQREVLEKIGKLTGEAKCAQHFADVCALVFATHSLLSTMPPEVAQAAMERGSHIFDVVTGNRMPEVKVMGLGDLLRMIADEARKASEVRPQPASDKSKLN